MFDVNNRGTWADKKVIGNRIHLLRLRSKLTRDQFCEKFYICLDTYRRWRSGISYPHMEVIERLASENELTVEDILSDVSKLDSNHYKVSRDSVDLWYDVDVPTRIQTLMQDRHVTSNQIAKALGVTQATVRNWITGRSRPCATIAVLLAKYFRISFNDLIKEDAN